jgi:hypothetical protein
LRSQHLINRYLPCWTVGFIDPLMHARQKPLRHPIPTSIRRGLHRSSVCGLASSNTLTISPNQKHHSTWSLHRRLLLPTTQIPVKRALPKQKTPHSLATRVNPLYIVGRHGSDLFPRFGRPQGTSLTWTVRDNATKQPSPPPPIQSDRSFN